MIGGKGLQTMTNEILLHLTISPSGRLLLHFVVKKLGDFDLIDCKIIEFEVETNVF